jgi:hypothetical protein
MMRMRWTAMLTPVLLLTACATKSGIYAPMHDVGSTQAGWEERKADNGNPEFVVRSNGGVTYEAMLQVAEQHAKERCSDGYRVISIRGADQPEVDILNPRIIIGGELRLEVECFEHDKY